MCSRIDRNSQGQVSEWQGLSVKARSALAFIVSYKRMNDGNSPTYRQIADHVPDLTYPYVGGVVDELVLNGIVRRPLDNQRGRSRHICLNGGSWNYEYLTLSDDDVK